MVEKENHFWRKGFVEHVLLPRGCHLEAKSVHIELMQNMTLHICRPFIVRGVDESLIILRSSVLLQKKNTMLAM